MQLVLHYDGAKFAGWQVQPEQRTVQGELERVLTKLCAQPIGVQGAGRTDAGVHARGQAASIRVPEKWSPESVRRAMNALLPSDVWVARSFEMHDAFHARFSALSRTYTYQIGVEDAARSPFRRPWEWHVPAALDFSALESASRVITGTHRFWAFAVRGTAPETDGHTCNVTHAQWVPRDGGLSFTIEANRFLHHMVRFLVGTMVEIASGKRPLSDMARLLQSETNDAVSAPAPAHGLFLERVTYPESLYLRDSTTPTPHLASA